MQKPSRQHGRRAWQSGTLLLNADAADRVDDRDKNDALIRLIRGIGTIRVQNKV
jgi:hypothetical protein